MEMFLSHFQAMAAYQTGSKQLRRVCQLRNTMYTLMHPRMPWALRKMLSEPHCELGHMNRQVPDTLAISRPMPF